MKVSETIKDIVARANELAFPNQTEEESYHDYIGLSISITLEGDFQCYLDIWHSEDGYTGYESRGTYLTEVVCTDSLPGVLNHLNGILTTAENDHDSDYTLDVSELSVSSIFVGKKEYRLVKQEH